MTELISLIDCACQFWIRRHAPLTSVTWLHHGNTMSEHAHYTTKWHIYQTHPQLINCPDNTKLVCHRRVHYKMEWIYTPTKVSGQSSLELALESRKKERLRIGNFLYYSWFRHTWMFPWMCGDLLSVDSYLNMIVKIKLLWVINIFVM